MKKWQTWFGLILIMFAVSVYGQDNDLQYRSDDVDGDKDADAMQKIQQRFRLGEILEGGISLHEIPILNPAKLLPINISNKVYAIIRVKLDPGRSISIHDFSLIHNYKGFNCVAVSPVPGEFNAERRVFTSSDSRKVYDLLFVLDIPDFNASITYRCTLHYLFATIGQIDVDVKLKNFDLNPIQFSSSDED